MRIVHLNVRLTEGGAARIALDLHNRALEAGYDSQFFYGYGSGAKPSPYESSIPGAAHLARRSDVIFNFLTHRLVGMEFLPPRGSRAKALRQAIREADVVHLHAVHSYFLPFAWLSEALSDAKRIVWTCHDYWGITGRCAFLEGCDGWRRGCGSCPSLRNYPPALIDLSGAQRSKRMSLINQNLDRIVFVAPSKFVGAQYRSAFPAAKVKVIYNGVDASIESALDGSAVQKSIGNEHDLAKILIVANDLSDGTKVDRDLIDDLIRISGIEVHVIGKNSPFEGNNVFQHGEIHERSQMVRIIRGMDALIFSSIKDTFGLVMIEALVCGVPVLALPSDAADEVLKCVGLRPYRREEIVTLLAEDLKRVTELRQLKDRIGGARYHFSGKRMFEQYAKLWACGN